MTDTQERDRLRFFKLSIDMLCICTPEGRFKDLNPAWEQALGYTRDELRARPFMDFVHPEDQERTLEEFNALLEDTTHDTVSFENRYVRKDGRVCWFLWRAKQDPERGLVYAIARDVTDLKRAKDELERFAFHAAHDLQEPLRKIAAFGDRLQKTAGELEERPRLYLDRMLDAARRMSTLISDLLQYARLSKEAEPEDVDLQEIVTELLVDMELAVTEAGATIQVGHLPKIEGDWTRMRQLFQNLISNALKFRRPGVAPVVQIESERVPEGVRLTVRDNGIGFDERYKEKIFQIFQRLHGRSEYEGTGIGLAVCARIAESHGGTIDVRSVLGEGAVFVVTLPLAEKVEQDA